jgi:hypothetical protein
MKGLMYVQFDNSQHSGYALDMTYCVCVDGLHVKYFEYRRESFDTFKTRREVDVDDIRPCDGSCRHPVVELPSYVEEEIKEFKKKKSGK